MFPVSVDPRKPSASPDSYFRPSDRSPRALGFNVTQPWCSRAQMPRAWDVVSHSYSHSRDGCFMALSNFGRCCPRTGALKADTIGLESLPSIPLAEMTRGILAPRTHSVGTSGQEQAPRSAKSEIDANGRSQHISRQRLLISSHLRSARRLAVARPRVVYCMYTNETTNSLFLTIV